VIIKNLVKFWLLLIFVDPLTLVMGPRHGISSWDLILSVYFYLNLLSTISKQQFWTLKAEPKSGSAASSFGSGYIHHHGRWHHYNGRDDKIKQVRQIRKVIPFSPK
jgi:hypothetical protein